MAVRKRRWRTRNGDVKEAWVVDYVDQEGDRHIETQWSTSRAHPARLFGSNRPLPGPL